MPLMCLVGHQLRGGTIVSYKKSVGNHVTPPQYISHPAPGVGPCRPLLVRFPGEPHHGRMSDPTPKPSIRQNLVPLEMGEVEYRPRRMQPMYCNWPATS
jgi:hypothetical protein